MYGNVLTIAGTALVHFVRPENLTISVKCNTIDESVNEKAYKINQKLPPTMVSRFILLVSAVLGLTHRVVHELASRPNPSTITVETTNDFFGFLFLVANLLLKTLLFQTASLA